MILQGIMDIVIDFLENSIAQGIILAFFEGVILAFVLAKFEGRSERKRDFQELEFVLTKFYSLIAEKQTFELFYFVKLLSDSEQKALKRALLMSIDITQDNRHSSGPITYLILRNEKYILKIDPDNKNFHRLRDYRIESKESFDFGKPENQPEILESFKTYVISCCNEFGVKV